MTGPDMLRVATRAITNRELYNLSTRKVVPFGPLDAALGVSGKSDVCMTCHARVSECAGHWGVLTLAMPVFHIGFLRALIEILQTICKTCGRVLLPAEGRATYLRAVRASVYERDTLRRARLRKRIVDEVKKATSASSPCICPWCGALNGQVKKVPGALSFKIIHDRHRVDKSKVKAVARMAAQSALSSASGVALEMAPHLKRMVEVLNPVRVRDLLRLVPTEEYPLLWADTPPTTHASGLEALVLTHLMVPPVAIRPSVPMDMGGGGSNEDDLTVKLQEIITMNTALQTSLERGGLTKAVMETWDYLQNQVSAFINGELPGLPAAMKSKRPIRGLAQRLKGKQGRFRGNLSGKRVDFSSRTVISPDPNLPIFCVGVPLDVAKTLTFPERVTEVNINYLRSLVLAGPEQHPGAVLIRSGGMTRHLSFADRNRAADSLRVGDVVERHLRDGDCVLFNRQPSLHKMSIMCHRAVVQPGRTFRFNECVCTPYNADFDGDEMNLHLPQTEEARAEAAMLMDVRENMITPRSGAPLIGATQDFLTAAYLLTQRDTFLTREEIAQAAATLGDACEHVDLPRPAVLKPVELWTGKQVASLLLRPNRNVKLHISFETKSQSYTSGTYRCPMDGWVIFRDGQLMVGSLDKATLGGGSKVGLVYTLCRDNHPAVAARALHRLTKMTSRWLQNWGCSIGIEDVTPSASVKAHVQQMLHTAYTEADRNIAQYRAGKLPLQPGCNEEQSIESILNSMLGKLRSSMGDMCMQQLSRFNSPKVMATCGSKGSTINVAQMVTCVGQQAVGGQRIAEGFVDRTLPTFPAHAKEPAAKGFVANSFYSGLVATEFFFHTMGGREGLVDTAVKTAETGYMQRRMMKALEDLTVQYDRTVRTAGGDVVQFVYGDDGLDPAYMEGNQRPADLSRLLLSAIVSAHAGDVVLGPELAPYADDATVLRGTPSTEDAAALSALRSRGAARASTVSTVTKPLPRGAVACRPAAQERDMAPSDVMTAVERVLSGPAFAFLSDTEDYGGSRFLGDIRSFFASRVADMRKRGVDIGLPAGQEWAPWDGVVSLSRARSGEVTVEGERSALLHHTMGITKSALLKALETALGKFRRAQIPPGEAVGALAAHSMGEPATQMTLKTFHFAGVASMNVTLGVPRIKEIMNASKTISTPIMEAFLEVDNHEAVARIVKARLERTTLADVAASIREVYDEDDARIEIRLHEPTLQSLYLQHVTPASVMDAIRSNSKLRLRDSACLRVSQGVITVRPPARASSSRQRAARQRAKERAREEERAALEGVGKATDDDNDDDMDVDVDGAGLDDGMAGGSSDSDDADIIRPGRPTLSRDVDFIKLQEETVRPDTYYGIQALKAALPSIIVAGIPSVNRAVIAEDSKAGSTDGPRYKLLVEGYGLLSVMGTAGVKAKKSISNHVLEVAECLGIEAARVVIMAELQKSYTNYGIGVDQRHLQLLADVMTYRGEILGVTRFGIAKMKDSVLMLASFEKTPDHLFDAAVHNRVDTCRGVSECIIVGAPIPVGTGVFGLMHDHSLTEMPEGTPAATRQRSGSVSSALVPMPQRSGLAVGAQPVTPVLSAAPDPSAILTDAHVLGREYAAVTELLL